MRYIRFLFCLAILCALPLVTSADEIAQVQSYLAQQVAAHKFSGDVLIAVHDNVVFERAYGDANVELHVPNTLRTRFRIFSMTKQFVAAALMTLAQQHKIDVSASVSRYLPNFPAAWKDVTVAELLEHSSGIPQLEDTWFGAFQKAPQRQSQCENYNAIANAIANSTLLTVPGHTWRYNNFGYDLLGCVVEQASGMRMAEYMKAAIFQPAGMTDSGLVGNLANPEPFYDGPRVIDDLASGYNGTLGVFDALQQAMPLQYGSAGAGDMYTTIGDLWRYSEALYRGQVLSNQTQQAMLDTSISTFGGESGPSCAPACAPLRRVTTRGVRWGLGWRIENVRGHVFMSHSGGTNGFTAELARFPEERATIVVLSNFGFSEVTGIRAAIAQRMFHGKYTVTTP